MEKVRVCFDVGGTYIKYGVFNQQNEWLDKGKFPTIVNQIDEFFSEMVHLVEGMNGQVEIEAIGLSFPGFINTETGYAEQAGAILALHEKNIIAEFQQRLSKAYTFYVENDANCAALAEMLNGHAQKNESFLLITLGTGIGGAIVSKGRILHGAQFRAGELGMMLLDWQSSHYQTAHDLASTSSLVKRYRECKKFPDDEHVSGRTILAQMATDEQVKQVVEEWLGYVSVMLFNLAATFNPEKILIGGGISQNPKLLPLILEWVQKNPHWQYFSSEIAICKHTNDAGLLGALYLIEQK